MKKALSIFLISLAAVLLTSAGIIFWLYSFLQSPAGSKYLLAELQNLLLKNSQTHFEYKEGIIHPFSSIHLTDLVLSQKSDLGLIQVQIKKIDIKYSISLWSRKLQIEQLIIDQPNILIHGSALPPPSKSQPTDLNLLAKMIFAPSIKVFIQHFSLTHMNLEVQWNLKDSKLVAFLKNMTLNSQFQLGSNKILLKGDLNIPQSNSVSFQSQFQNPSQIHSSFPQKEMKLSFSPEASAQWNIQLELKDNQFIYEIQPAHFSFALKDLSYLQAGKPTINTEISMDGILQKSNAQPQVELIGKLQIQNQDLFRFKAQSDLKTNPLEISSEFDSILNKNIIQLLPPDLTQQPWIYQLGEWSTHSEFIIKLQKEYLQTHGETTLSQTNLSNPFHFTLSIPKPIKIHHQLEINQGKANFAVKTSAPIFEIKNYAQMMNSSCLIQINSPNIYSAKNVNFSVDFSQKEIILNPQLNKSLHTKLPSLTELKANLTAELKDENIFSLKQFNTELNHSMIQLSAEASGNKKTQDFQTQGIFTMNLPENLSPIAGNRIYGKIELPWTLAVFHGRQISFEGNALLSNLNWLKSPTSLSPYNVKIKGITGKIPILLQFLRNRNEFKFSNLITQNPFERVDFERVQPLILESEQVDIHEIDFEEKKYGPFQGFFSIRQNMVFVHKFDLKLGSGSTYGELYMNALPSNLALGVRSRLTGLDLAEILPKKYIQKPLKGDQKISGRSGIIINLNQNSLNGRIDINEIGGTQLITLINVLDPKYENEQMNHARSALGLAYPTFVQMSFQNGFMDMNITLNGLVNQGLRGIPISPWISNATAEIVKLTKKGPIK